MRKHVSFLAAALLSALTLPAQIVLPGPGKYVATVSVKVYVSGKLTNYKGEMYLIDPVTLKAQPLTVPALAKQVGFNSITAVSPVTGYLTTIDGRPSANPKSGGDLYRYILAGTRVTLVKLNTKPFTGGNLAQVAQVGSDLYLCTQDASGKAGLLWSVPAGGGAPKLIVDFGKLTGYAGLANGLAALGGKIYVATWPYGQPLGCQLWEYDPATKTAAKVMDLPKGLYTTYIYPVHITVDKAGKRLIVVGLYRDIVCIDPVTKKVTQYHAGNIRSSTMRPYYYKMLNSGVFNPDTGDVWTGTRAGGVDAFTGSHGVLDLVPGVGTSPTAAYNSVTGITYFPSGARTATYGNGGLGSPATSTYRFWPANLNLGYPIAGKKFGFHLNNATGGAPSILLLGVSKTSWAGIPLPFDLGPFGAPGNYLRCSAQTFVPFTASGSGPGKGKADFLISSVPSAAKGYTLYSQWMILDKGANNLGIVMTNARESLVQ